MTEEELRPALESFTIETLWQYCDSFGLERPATKEATITLLAGSCPECIEDKLSRNARYVVTYLNTNKPVINNRVSEPAKPCAGCNK